MYSSFAIQNITLLIGGSHDRTDLLPLKAGVSLMALGAMASNPDLKLKIVPVGMSYFHPDKFRSRVVVEFGSAMDVPEDLVNKFKLGGADKREAVGKLLDTIYNALKIVTIRAPDYDTLMVRVWREECRQYPDWLQMIQAARRLYVTPGQQLTLGQVVQLNKRFLQAYVMFKDEPRVQKLQKDVIKYNRILRDLGLRDHQVRSAQLKFIQSLTNSYACRFHSPAKQAGRRLVFCVTESYCWRFGLHLPYPV